MHRIACQLYDPYDREHDYRAVVDAYEDGVIQIDTRSFVEWWIYMYGSFEGGAVDLLRRLIHPGSVVIDVGANVGTFALPFARAAGSLHAFEPHPRVRARLIENIALNNLRNTVVSDLALSDETGSAVLFGAAHANQMQGSMVQRDPSAESIVCPMDTLDNYVSRAACDRVDLIKVDVEGAEHKVLLGAKNVLTEHRPALYVEVNPAYLGQFGSSPQMLGEYLRGLGYSLWNNLEVERRAIGKGHGLVRIEHDWPTEQRDHYWLAVHEDTVPVRSAALGERH